MSKLRNNFTLSDLANKCNFIRKLDLYKFYEELDKLYKDEGNHNLYDMFSHLGVEDPDVIKFLKKITRILKGLSNQEISVDKLTKTKNNNCTYFKYWLYDKLIIHGLQKQDIKIISDFLNSKKNYLDKIVSSNKPCKFYKLNLNDIYELKNIFDYSEIFHDADISIYDEILKDPKYLNYLKNGLSLYRRGKIRCLSGKKNEYCNEFNEYANNCNNYETRLPYLSCREKFLSSLLKKDTTSKGEPLRGDGTNEDTLDSTLYKLLEKDKIVAKTHINEFYKALNTYNGTYTVNTCNLLTDNLMKEKDAICNLFRRVENILEKWDDFVSKYDNLDPKDACDYLNYWIYGKIGNLDGSPCDIDNFYFLWHKHSIYESKNKNKNKCFNEKYYGFNTEELRNKKKVFDFLVYYESIKNKLKEAKNECKKDYCSYIKHIFELYKIMEWKNDSHSYKEELILFQNKFSSNKELYYLEENCPDMCLGFVFNKKLKTLCPFEENTSLKLTKEKVKQCENLVSNKVPGEIDKNNEDYNFSSLPSATVYNKLNGEVITDYYYSICEKLIPLNDKHCGIYNLCTKLVRNLKELSTMKKKERTDRCEYIIHWIYHEISKIPNIISENIYESVALREFFNIVYNVLRKLDITNCFFNTININFNEHKEKKYLHDYFKNYDKIKNEGACNGEECKKYCKYVLFINEIYGKHINKCCYCYKSEGCKENYPYYFKCDDNYNPHTLFKKLKCNNFEEFREKFKKADTPMPEDHYVKRLAYISLNVPHLLNRDNKKSSIIPDVVSDKITSDPFHTFALGSFGFLGVLLILFILYRFTPMGSYFNNRNTRNKESYFENFEHQFLEHNVQFNRGNTQNRRMRIAYHQA
ncbi:PIR Superfamily Protein [Plasmodium ovale curtisi]|uniref:PIR Superfamily Protein n=2 Tax=Plasmodium ovale TaxID=36330 RepID=A0A1A8WI74_PLAOA|nr:PIR Superfamily Protein [Plasmodium ovale curtisi]